MPQLPHAKRLPSGFVQGGISLGFCAAVASLNELDDEVCNSDDSSETQCETPVTQVQDCAQYKSGCRLGGLFAIESLMMSLAKGTRLGPYQILAPLGAGGMGEVYKALDTRLNRFVAIKILRPERVSDRGGKQRFIQEAKAASALNHPNIITLYDISVDNGRDYLVMEYVPGKTLDALIRRTGMPFDEILKIAIPLADGLSAAHGAGIIHRDLKPSNIMVAETGMVKILDFGLAKLVVRGGVTEEDETLTLSLKAEPGTVLGTAAYMSPEQAKGEPVDARSDIFSFGAVLYHLATGRRAFSGKSIAGTMTAVINQEPREMSKSAPAQPHEFERIVMRCLRKDAARRQQHMSDVKVLLEELKVESESGKLQAALTSKILRPRWPWVAIAALVLTTAASLGLWLAHSREEQPPRVVPLTTLAGTENFPSFSPDGNHVVFTWSGEKQNNRDLYVKMIGSTTALRLTTDAAPHLFPAWSPDGRQIAFLKGGERPGIYLISPLGGPEQKIADFDGVGEESLSASAPAWSPDGRFLVVAKLRHQPKSNPDEGALFLVPVQGGEPRPLLVPESGRSYGSPAIAPDGHSLAFASCGDTGPTCALSLASFNPDLVPQGRPRKIRDVPAQIAGVAWTADGRSIIYSAGTSMNDYFLWRVDLAGTEPKRLDIASQGSIFPAVALKGNRLAFSRFLSDQDIWRLEAGGRPEPFLVSSMVESNAQFSPDGRHIAFASGRSVDRVAIWLCDANGASLAQLTRGPGTYDGSPRWSPDGRWIAFDALGNDGRRSIRVVDSSGGQPRQLTSGPLSSRLPSWSRDGRWIYFSSDRTGRSEIWRMPAQGGAAEQITQDGGYVALESVDGKTLYYTKSGSYSGVPLYARPLDANEERQVLDQVAGRGFVVLEDGIYYLSYTGLRTAEIRFQELATGRSRAVGPIPAPVGLGLSVSPDRKTFLFAEWAAAEFDLMLIENFR
jgi:Tol biopolymer transport system component/tRNA A-37 threonylcarbamoyl transferase component Bud32